ncbi:hypothetical protein LAM23_23415, partial [Mycobacterium tuberculosis]|nr:hypothetical protein [Mycobacterium tuberculosis]
IEAKLDEGANLLCLFHPKAKYPISGSLLQRPRLQLTIHHGTKHLKVRHEAALAGTICAEQNI